MTKATLLMVAGLVVAAALLAVACDGPPAGNELAGPSDPEQQERQSETPKPEATAVPGETRSGRSSLLGGAGGVEPDLADLSFASVSAGLNHTCGVTTSGDALCWGSVEFGQATLPAGVSFTSLSAGYSHTCGVTASGDALCWGFDGYGRQNALPAGVSFESINAGDFHSCGVTTTGAALCWGDKIANPRIEYGVAMTKWVRLGFRVKGIVPESLSSTGHTELFGRWL